LHVWLCALVTLITTSLISKELSTFSGMAYNEHQEHLFTEEYLIEKEENKITRVTTKFFSPQGALMAEMCSNFPYNSYLASVHFEKKEDPTTYGTLISERGIELFKTTASQLRKHKTINIQKTMVAGHGFYFYILESLTALLAGESRELTFLQPNRLNSYTFKMKATALPHQEHLVKVSLTLDNRLLKAFVPDISLVIDRRNNSLVSYEGVSGFFSFDESLSLKKISVTYTQPTPILANYSKTNTSNEPKGPNN